MLLLDEKKSVRLVNDLAKELFGEDVEKDLYKPLFEKLEADVFMSMSSGNQIDYNSNEELKLTSLGSLLESDFVTTGEVAARFPGLDNKIVTIQIQDLIYEQE